MALHEITTDPAFRCEVRASGLGEVWTHTHDKEKFNQFGWKCLASSYKDSTLLGNWNEERRDLHHSLIDKPLPSQYEHYFQTTSRHDYGQFQKPVGLDNPARRLKLKRLVGKEPTAYPGHQPELDTDLSKDIYNSYMTTSRVAYVNPTVRLTPQTFSN